MDDNTEILYKIHKQLKEMIELLREIAENTKEKTFVPPDCEHL